MKNVVVVGVGGVGTHLVGPLCRYLAAAHPGSSVTLVDGDTFEPKNRERQEFSEYGNKAEVVAHELQNKFPELVVQHVSSYMTPDDAWMYVPDGATVFSCVDNHASRKMLSEHVSSLDDAVLVSGGNDYHDGNVQVYVRKGGVDVTPPLTYMHPEIEEPDDKNPAEMDCMEAALAGTPQLIFANMKVATEMASTFWSLEANNAPQYTEAYFDLKTGRQRVVDRRPG
jgi:molybdopterin/thiamine biosynthesis adenylyltransferase